MHFVVDTSYLDVLLDIDGYSSASARPLVLAHVRTLLEQGSVLYVPVPVVFEICNHIAHVVDGNVRLRLAEQFVAAVKSSISDGVPWKITAHYGDELLSSLAESLDIALTRFRADYVASRIGLTDVAIIREAERLATAMEIYPQPRPPVHILTNDRTLKAHEPEPQPDALLW